MKILPLNNTLLSDTMLPRKPLKKLGTVAVDRCESTPVVWHGRLLRLDAVDRTTPTWAAQFFDALTGEPISAKFAVGTLFASAYEAESKMYVLSTRKAAQDALVLSVSDDLVHWQTKTVFPAPAGWTFFNTSVCASPDGYTVALEIGGTAEAVGQPFTIVYLRASDAALSDLASLDPTEAVYTPERYAACPVLRWCDGWYYMIYLEALPLWHFVPYIVRSRDLIAYEPGVLNPVLTMSAEDKLLYRDDWFTDVEKRKIAETCDVNNSDVDLCDYNGKCFIVYSWGTQMGKEFLAYAEYDGSMAEFLRSFFPDNH